MSARHGVAQASHKTTAPPAVLDWQDHALCTDVDHDIFFPEKDDLATLRTAQQVCADCPVRTQCLEHALTHGEQAGVWGGVSAAARRRLRQQQKAASR